ncbi:ribonuclease BN [Halosimplex salinum]|uniref:ribonuclease BN n=1 Tax=Halosimplex salinum TaxID=1710538 RepID=UPI000F4806D8|nr:ribonuclease BN [Halosimplex salinum]
MTADTGADDDASGVDDERSASPDPGPTPGPGAGTDTNRDERGEEVEELRAELDALRERIDEKTVHRDDIRAELRRYVRKRQRRGHATGWGPYLVLLYGTAMTVAAFWYLAGWAAVAAMLVIWLSTLGLYVFMVVVGSFLAAGRKAAGLRDLVGKFR